MSYISSGVVCSLLCIAFVVSYAVGRRRDARMLRNGVFLTAAVFSAVLALLLLAAAVFPPLGVLAAAMLVLGSCSIPFLGIALIANGIRMFRSEGHSLGNMLSLILGLLVFVLPSLAVVLLSFAASMGRSWLAGAATAVSYLIVLSCAYASTAFLSFAMYSVVYARTRHRSVPEVIVVLGSGLVRGQVPPLLRSRLDGALRVYRDERAAGRRPLVIPSGGQGEDEPRPEGVAMAEYLVRAGVAPEDVRAEVLSRNTRENLRFARRLQLDADRDGPMLVVTNNYHVLRAASLARTLELDAQVVGAPTAPYYVPSAFLREFVAVLVEHRWVNLVAFSPFLAVFAVVVWEIVGVS